MYVLCSEFYHAVCTACSFVSLVGLCSQGYGPDTERSIVLICCKIVKQVNFTKDVFCSPVEQSEDMTCVEGEEAACGVTSVDSVNSRGGLSREARHAKVSRK